MEDYCILLFVDLVVDRLDTRNVQSNIIINRVLIFHNAYCHNFALQYHYFLRIVAAFKCNSLAQPGEREQEKKDVKEKCVICKKKKKICNIIKTTREK